MSKGKEKLQESLSALMDNEANEFEFRRILKECEGNDELKLKWERFHLLSAAIKGELDNSLNAGFPVLDKKADDVVEKRPDLLFRINAELDGLDERDESASSPTLFNKAASSHSTVNNRINMFRRMGQGAIAASVAAIVLVAGGALSPLVQQEPELQFAEQTGISEDIVPEFDDAYSPSEFSLVPQLYTEFTETESLEEAARVRLRQAVFQEFVGQPQESIEFPVNFNVIIEEE